MVGRGVLRFKKGVCSKRVSGSVVLEAFSCRARFISTTVVQIGVARSSGTAFLVRFGSRLGVRVRFRIRDKVRGWIGSA